VDSISNRLKDRLLKPMAVDAADKVSGPSVLKIRKTSTRMEAETRRKPNTVNKLSKVVQEAFFGPLMARWWIYLQDWGYSTPNLHPHLLSLYVKTLTILLHSSGSNTLTLPAMTSAFWEFLLSLRSNPLTNENASILDAILVGFLTIFEINSEDRYKRIIAEEKAKELMETQEWVIGIFEGGEAVEGDGEKRRGLAAAVLLKTREVVEKYERLLMGEMI